MFKLAHVEWEGPAAIGYFCVQRNSLCGIQALVPMQDEEGSKVWLFSATGGNNQKWSYQYFNVSPHARYIKSGGIVYR